MFIDSIHIENILLKIKLTSRQTQDRLANLKQFVSSKFTCITFFLQNTDQHQMNEKNLRPKILFRFFDMTNDIWLFKA